MNIKDKPIIKVTGIKTKIEADFFNELEEVMKILKGNEGEK